jgi:hypothetical protein
MRLAARKCQELVKVLPRLHHVVVQIDTSAPLLRPSQLTALVRAVHCADPNDEHRWIEWKSTVDLSTPSGTVNVVKHIIGLANRQPAAAAQPAGGYGYVLFGVGPGSITGIAALRVVSSAIEEQLDRPSA